MGRVDGKVAIVTGGTSGIGEGVVRLLIREGARVIVVARGEARGKRLERELGRQRAQFLCGDVTSEATAVAAVAEAARLGGPDILVNCAGVDLVKSVCETSADDMNQVLATNLVGAFLMLRIVGQAMLDRSSGSIVNVTSRTASVGVAGMSAYSASKGGLLALTKTAAIEWASRGVRVNAVAPGVTETPLITEWVEGQAEPGIFRDQLGASIPQGRMGQPEETARAIVFLASDEASHIVGVSLAVDGGYTAA